MIIGTNERNPPIFDPYRFGLLNAPGKPAARIPATCRSWQTDHDDEAARGYAIVDDL